MSERIPGVMPPGAPIHEGEAPNSKEMSDAAALGLITYPFEKVFPKWSVKTSHHRDTGESPFQVHRSRLFREMELRFDVSPRNTVHEATAIAGQMGRLVGHILKTEDKAQWMKMRGLAPEAKWNEDDFAGAFAHVYVKEEDSPPEQTEHEGLPTERQVDWLRRTVALRTAQIAPEAYTNEELANEVTLPELRIVA